MFGVLGASICGVLGACTATYIMLYRRRKQEEYKRKRKEYRDELVAAGTSIYLELARLYIDKINGKYASESDLQKLIDCITDGLIVPFKYTRSVHNLRSIRESLQFLFRFVLIQNNYFWIA